VTASVDHMTFLQPIHIGELITLRSSVNRAFNTSMEVHMKVWGENLVQQHKYKSNEAYYTYQVFNQAIVVPETIDAMRALTGTEQQGERSIQKTDQALGITKEFLKSKEGVLTA